MKLETLASGFLLHVRGDVVGDRVAIEWLLDLGGFVMAMHLHQRGWWQTTFAILIPMANNTIAKSSSHNGRLDNGRAISIRNCDLSHPSAVDKHVMHSIKNRNLDDSEGKIIVCSWEYTDAMKKNRLIRTRER